MNGSSERNETFNEYNFLEQPMQARHNCQNLEVIFYRSLKNAQPAGTHYAISRKFAQTIKS